MPSRKSAFAQGVLISGFALASAACGGPLTYTPHGTARAPEADAHITAEVHRESANTLLTIRVDHLAPPDRIQQGATAFVVWERRDQNAQWLRIGSLIYNPSDRTGQLQATAPDTGFELAITAENDTSPTSPSANIVVDQRVGSVQQQPQSTASTQASAAPSQ